MSNVEIDIFFSWVVLWAVMRVFRWTAAQEDRNRANGKAWVGWWWLRGIPALMLVGAVVSIVIGLRRAGVLWVTPAATLADEVAWPGAVIIVIACVWFQASIHREDAEEGAQVGKPGGPPWWVLSLGDAMLGGLIVGLAVWLG